MSRTSETSAATSRHVSKQTLPARMTAFPARDWCPDPATSSFWDAVRPEWLSPGVELYRHAGSWRALGALAGES